MSLGGASGTADGPILVTGAAGFLGRKVVRSLRVAGYQVVALDTGGTGTATGNLWDPVVIEYRVDLRDWKAIRAVCAAIRPWGVVHLAARHFIPACQASPQETWQVNVTGTGNLLEALAGWPPRVLVFASTADVYLERAAPCAETDPVGPRTVYGQSKLAAERQVQAAARAWGSRMVIARIFNLYGPEPTVDHLIPAIITQALESDELALGHLTSARDFVYAGDAADAITELVSKPDLGILNIGTGTATSGEQVVRMVAAILGRDLIVRLDQRRVRRLDRRVLVARTDKIRAVLPWWPRTSLDDGLAQMIGAIKDVGAEVR